MIKPFKKPILITRPIFPSRWKLSRKLKQIWKSRQLTNRGDQLRTFEDALKNFLHTQYLSVCCNGTLALQLAIQAAAHPGSEVITTPFSFVATAQAIRQNGLRPVFCDINITDYNIDSHKIEQCIGHETAAIVPVHVFGVACDTTGISETADYYHLPVIYDAAHCFGVEKEGRSIFSFGDASVCSFHATKIFHTIEGGVVVSDNPHITNQVDINRNFGITTDRLGKQHVATLGTNAKMNEVQAAVGLLVLDEFEKERQKRKRLTEEYVHHLKDMPGLHFQTQHADTKPNYYNCTIRIDSKIFGINRECLRYHLRRYNVHARRYFFPSLDQLMYHSNARQGTKLTNTRIVSEQVLSLPLYGSLSLADVRKICGLIRGHCRG